MLSLKVCSTLNFMEETNMDNEIIMDEVLLEKSQLPESRIGAGAGCGGVCGGAGCGGASLGVGCGVGGCGIGCAGAGCGGAAGGGLCGGIC